jgi:hypothetical protein
MEEPLSIQGSLFRSSTCRMQTLRVFALLSFSVGVFGGCSAEPKHRVFFLGVDGVNWKVIGPMIEAGELPNFSRLVREGAVMREFGTMDTTSSAVVWTTVATGRESVDHGVIRFVEKLPNGERIPISSNSRKAKAIWEIATENDVSVGVAGWWASWPAEEVNGWIISDHANPAFSEFLISDQQYWTAGSEKLSALQRDFYPADLASI